MTRIFGTCTDCKKQKPVDAWGVCQECNDVRLSDDEIESFEYDYEEDDNY